jgi:hypothetical protein
MVDFQREGGLLNGQKRSAWDISPVPEGWRLVVKTSGGSQRAQVRADLLEGEVGPAAVAVALLGVGAEMDCLPPGADAHLVRSLGPVFAGLFSAGGRGGVLVVFSRGSRTRAKVKCNKIMMIPF